AAAPRVAQRGRNDHLEPAARGARAARARGDAGPRRVPVGQGLLRRCALRQDRLPRPRDAVAGGGVRRARGAARGRAARPVAHRLRRPGGLRPHLPGRDVLAETLGVILYQDQVLQVCQALAGFTAGQAEALRRAMSRRRSRELMAGFWEEFRSGAAARGVTERVAEKVFTQVIAFSEFGFPKSHAAAFGLLAYQSAWLRHYHPAEYYCALFNNQPMGFYSLDALGRDAKRNGIEIRLPDVNESDVGCTGDLTPFPPLLAGEGGRTAVRVGRVLR